MGRGAIALGLVLVAASVDLTAGAGSAQARTDAAATVSPGFGKAQAQLLMIDPRAAQLSFGVRFGPTVADHRNLVARAEALSTDYGLIGGAITGAGCDGRPAAITPEQLPQPIRADSREPKDATEATVTEGPVTQSVLALDRPFAQATSRLVEVSLPAALLIEGATDATSSGVDPKGVPTVHAEVEVARVSLLGGIIELRGLRWETTNRAGEKPVGLFTIGSASIGGTPLPTQDASATVNAINDVVSKLGIVITPPVSHLEGDTLFVDPMRIGIAPNATRDQIAATVLSTVQPAREALFQFLLDNYCDAGGAITVVDLLLGSVSGGGSFTAALGGAQAQLTPGTETTKVGGGGTRPPTPPVTAPSTGKNVSFPSVLPDGGTVPVVPGTAPTELHPVTTAAKVSHPSDGALAVALVVLALGAALVEGDRRKMGQAGVLAAPPIAAPTETNPG